MVQMPAEDTVFATGTLAAQDRAVLSAKVPGRVQEILVDLGHRVKAGDILARIEQEDYQLRRDQAQAALNQAQARLGLEGSLEGKPDLEKASIVKEAFAVFDEARRNRDRIVQLRTQGIISEAELETAEGAFRVAENRYEAAINEAQSRLAALRERAAELGLAEQQLRDTAIRAPFDGMIEARQTSPGEFLQESTPLLTIVRIDPVRLRMEVPEKDAHRVQAGQPVKLQLEGGDAPFLGKVARLSPVINLSNRMLMVEADFPNKDGLLRPGAFAKAEIVVDHSRLTLFVPESAVTTFAGLQKVYTVANGKVLDRNVRVGRQKEGKVEVLEGLRPGDSVIIDPAGLKSGQAVAVSNRQT